VERTESLRYRPDQLSYIAEEVARLERGVAHLSSLLRGAADVGPAHGKRAKRPAA